MSTDPGSDPIGDFQRWLMRTGAKSIGKDVASRVRSTVGGGKSAKQGDVWDTATTEELTDEPPECQWCPICRAARRYRDSGGSTANLGGQFAGVGDTLAGLTRDAFSLFDAALRQAQRPAPSQGSRPADRGPADHGPSGQAPADDHFVPPVPPPLPRLDPVTKGAWLALFGGPLYLLISTAIGTTISGLAAFLAVAAFVGGFVILVLRMDNGRPPDSGSDDDGAVV